MIVRHYHPREHAKRPKGQEEDEARARKKECRDMEAARRASLAYEKACRIKAVESLLGHLAQEMWGPRKALLIVMLLMRTLLKVSRLKR